MYPSCIIIIIMPYEDIFTLGLELDFMDVSSTEWGIVGVYWAQTTLHIVTQKPNNIEPN